MLLALDDAKYRFLWIDCELSGSSSDAQIFYRGDFREKIKNGSLGLPTPKPLGEGGPDLHYFFLDDDTFALTSWIAESYCRRQLTREERIANLLDLQRQGVVEMPFLILVSRFRVLLVTMEQRPKVVRDTVFTCVVLHNMLRTHKGRAGRAPTQENDVAVLQNEQAVYMPNENFRNPSREAKHQ